ncbi:hypothetical protein J4E91_009481 [Alternaria rosae]|nr:hypothetical protein J4E91_009481 [Alternaria rosae]
MATQEESQVTTCKEFLQTFERWSDPTWGFFVYGTYTRTQGQEVSNEDTVKESETDSTGDDAHFQAMIRKVYAHATDSLRYTHPAPYNQKMIDNLRLDPAAYMPGASLDVVCKHFRQHYAQKVFPETMHEPGPPAIQDDIPDEEKLGPKWSWCIVIDDEALESLENGPEPIGDTPPEGVSPRQLQHNAKNAFVKLLSGMKTTMEKPQVMSASGRAGAGVGTVWNGWLKFSPVDLMGVWIHAEGGIIEDVFDGEDKLFDW